MIKALLDPILEDGIPFTAFFNGRLLSGEDLARDQQGHREARRRLGQAAGDGVAFGLEVFESPGESTKSAPVVSVRPGVAVSRDGHALSLGRQVDLRLVRASATGPDAAAATAFRRCDPQQPGVYVVGEGVYVLMMSSATAGEGRAPVGGLGNAASSCNVRAIVEGVQFRLVQPSFAPALVADRTRVRHRVAALALGVRDRPAPYLNPIAGAPASTRLVDALKAAGAVSDADVPLAVLHWTAGGGITFVDRWSVRRRLAPRGAGERWAWLFGERVRAEAEAIFLQFQEQIDDMAASGDDLAKVAAADRFEYLPPLGILPLKVGTRAGFDPQTFFGAAMLPKDVAFTDGDLLRDLARESFAHDPVVLAPPERVQLYLVHENVQAAGADPAVTPVLVFARRTLRYRGVARYGIARWDLSRFAPRVI